MGSVVAMLLIALACGREPTAPTPGGTPSPPTIGTGGGSGAGALVGSWQRTSILQLVDDLRRNTTTWRFDADGACEETVETLDLIEDIPRTETHACTYRVDATDVVITFTGATADVRFTIQFDGFSPQRLVLDGLLFDRIA
jgi:hypothetical protein